MRDYVLVRVLKSCKIALPEKDVELQKEDVITLPLSVVFPLWKRGVIEIINTSRGEENDMGNIKSESMANVEG